jgi:hypothetical protein
MKLVIRPPLGLGSTDLEMGDILFPDWWQSDLWQGGRAPTSPKTNGPAMIVEKRSRSQGNKEGTEQLPKPKRPPKQKCPPVPYQILEDHKWVQAYFSSNAAIEQHGFDK